MKKILYIILAAVTAISVCACNGSNSNSNSKNETAVTVKPPTEQSTTLNKGQLDMCLKHITDANNYVVKIASKQMENWTTSSTVKTYFDQESFDIAYKSGYTNTVADTINYLRDDATEAINKAESIFSQQKGEGDYYLAIKEYYKAVKKFYNFVTTVPTGHSKITFSQAVAEYNTNCNDAFSEAKMYK